ncbi:MAG: FHA domain-containing protein, partial [Myxococcota bacterium]
MSGERIPDCPRAVEGCSGMLRAGQGTAGRRPLLCSGQLMSGSEKTGLTTVHRPRPAHPDAAAGFVLTVSSGPDAGSTLAMDGTAPGRLLVGTSPACALRLTDREVSRRHAAFEIVGPDVHLTDLQSTNGTRVNGVRVVEALLEGG